MVHSLVIALQWVGLQAGMGALPGSVGVAAPVRKLWYAATSEGFGQDIESFLLKTSRALATMIGLVILGSRNWAGVRALGLAVVEASVMGCAGVRAEAGFAGMGLPFLPTVF